MGHDVLASKCRAHNRILRRLEPCAECLQKKRAEAVAKAGPKKRADPMRMFDIKTGREIKGEPFLGGWMFRASSIETPVATFKPSERGQSFTLESLQPKAFARPGLIAADLQPDRGFVDLATFDAVWPLAELGKDS